MGKIAWTWDFPTVLLQIYLELLTFDGFHHGLIETESLEKVGEKNHKGKGIVPGEELDLY